MKDKSEKCIKLLNIVSSQHTFTKKIIDGNNSIKPCEFITWNNKTKKQNE